MTPTARNRINDQYRLPELIARAEAQEAYGKWNTAPLRNHIARIQDEQRTPFTRAVSRICGYVILIVGCGFGYGAIVLSLVNMFVRG